MLLMYDSLPLPLPHHLSSLYPSHKQRCHSLFFFIALYHQDIKPTVLIGTSGVGKTFTKEVIEAMASFNEVNFCLLI